MTDGTKFARRRVLTRSMIALFGRRMLEAEEMGERKEGMFQGKDRCLDDASTMTRAHVQSRLPALAEHVLLPDDTVKVNTQVSSQQHPRKTSSIELPSQQEIWPSSA